MELNVHRLVQQENSVTGEKGQHYEINIQKWQISEDPGIDLGISVFTWNERADTIGR
jgi:hypothetical protein